MYLKSIDLFGFKTFAERTHLDFHPGVSGIVGPNGSGKSNFVDAVRWVLGEQSARQLRGARMDDVIFAGNTERRPLGMAEVTLTFDNSDGALATPFAEIAITRRAYRSGESEFFLNKSQVRLRDITDLLLGTGLAAELAAIVSQGEIDAILSAKPEARRELFEGVAGTARYRVRKREAQRRLEQTATNALRVNDLLAELEKQIPAIEQQVRRAKRYQKVNAQLRDFEILSYVRKTSERRAERTSITASLGDDERTATSIAHHHAELQTALNRARYEEYQATLALDERNAAHTKLAEQLQHEASAAAAASARAGELERGCEALEQELDAAAHAVTLADARLASAVEGLARSRQERDQALSVAESAAALEAAGTAQWERAYAALRAVEDERTEAVARSAQSASASAAARAELGRVAAAMKRLDKDSLAVAAGIEQAQRRHEEALRELDRAKRQADDAARAQHDARDLHKAAVAHLDQARAAREKSQTALLELQAKVQALRQFRTGTSGAPAGVQELLEAAAAGSVRGIIGTVASVIQVDDRHAIAIDAALGPHAHDVIVGTLQDAKAAMQALKRKPSGRATIIALEALPQAARSTAPAGKGVVGRAADLVRCDATVKPAVEHALGNCFIVATLDDAFANAQRNGDAAFATSDGDVIRGGVIASGEGTGPVSAQASVAALERELDSARATVEQRDQALAAAVRATDDAAKRVEGSAEAISAVGLQSHTARTAVERIAHELRSLEERTVELRRQKEEAQMQGAAAARAIEQQAPDAGELAARVDALEAKRRDALTAADALAKELAQTRANHRAAASAAAAMVERVAQLSDDVETARADLERAQTQRKDRVAQLQAMREERQQSADEATRFATSRDEAQKALALVAAELVTVRERRDAHAGRTRELDEAYAREEQQAKEQSSELERLRIRLAEIDAELAVLQETFSQNPATEHECADVQGRYQEFEGDADAQVRRLREELVRLGNVNLNALEDRAATMERCEFLRQQLRDLEAARAGILASIAEMDAESLRKFNETFEKVAVAFSETFTRLFNGGNAKIWVAAAEDPTEAGIEISAQPPGKKMQHLNLLSGGERALTAVALIFATLQVRPSPFYIFDEIDAALDEANVGRFGVQLAELARNGRSQIIIITHNKATMTLVDRMYGVTMSEPGVSNILSLSLERAGAPG
ncbi:MAG: chromosome segregation protein SMC [Candidatus Eremiobacteraeota bacterium]|nr:chromosome segregation protein SMC [Candidatus Eremiobacteraeota bacterium]MBV8338627.1 chromosome segregation protein SMC [Candidatus Eremiobacteraeota bacterium]